MIGKFVIIRSYAAGVHCGTLTHKNGKEVTLENARRVWYWRGANTLHEMSQKGISADSKVSEPVPQIVIHEAEETIPCSNIAMKNLTESRWN